MPEKPEKDKTPRKSRRESIRKDLALGDNEPLEMPDCEAGYLVEYLFEIGPALPSGMGQSPITHGEILAWQQNTGIELDAWQARKLRELSALYVAESSVATDPGAEAPWAEAPYAKPAPNLVALRMKQGIAELAAM